MFLELYGKKMLDHRVAVYANSETLPISLFYTNYTDYIFVYINYKGLHYFVRSIRQIV